jgi:hypothetical protein
MMRDGRRTGEVLVACEIQHTHCTPRLLGERVILACMCIARLFGVVALVLGERVGLVCPARAPPSTATRRPCPGRRAARIYARSAPVDTSLKRSGRRSRAMPSASSTASLTLRFCSSTS